MALWPPSIDATSHQVPKNYIQPKTTSPPNSRAGSASRAAVRRESTTQVQEDVASWRPVCVHFGTVFGSHLRGPRVAVCAVLVIPDRRVESSSLFFGLLFYILSFFGVVSDFCFFPESPPVLSFQLFTNMYNLEFLESLGVTVNQFKTC